MVTGAAEEINGLLRKKSFSLILSANGVDGVIGERSLTEELNLSILRSSL